MKTDVRQDRRYPFDRIFPLSYKAGGGEIRLLLVRGRDISRAGVRVLSPEPLAVSCSVFLRDEEDHLVGNAVVRHCRKNDGGFVVGLEFSGFTRGDSAKAGNSSRDFYEFMQISPHAEVDTIHRVYRLLAAQYHPDNAETGDPEKFLHLQKVYETLSNPATREAYDAQFRGGNTQACPSYTPNEFIDDVWGESRRRLAILCLLYNRRRTDADKPLIGLLDFERLMSCDRETLAFSLWYLREKSFIQTEGNTEYAITVAGVERVESEAPAARAVCKLLERATAAQAA